MPTTTRRAQLLWDAKAWTKRSGVVLRVYFPALADRKVSLAKGQGLRLTDAA